MNEAAFQVLEGQSIESVDRALVQFGFPVGPITLLDEVGIDVGAKISPILSAELGERFTAPSAFDALLSDDRKGKKNKRGFYLYNKQTKGKKQVDESVYKLLNITVKETGVSEADIAKRCVVQMLNEAARCLEDGIIVSARDGDMGAIFGIGFPPFTAGPFSYMDTMGIKQLVNELEALEQTHGQRFAPCQLLREMAEQEKTFY